MKLIPLSKGKFAKVDDAQFPYLSKWKWHYSGGYAERKEYHGGKQFHIQMHRVVLAAQPGHAVDHINGDTLDNQRMNLRPATHSTNGMNMRKHRGKSRYKGVTPIGKNFRVQIWKDSEKVFDATAPNERWAAMMYDLNAPALFGEFARLNFSAETAARSVDG